MNRRAEFGQGASRFRVDEGPDDEGHHFAFYDGDEIVGEARVLDDDVVSLMHAYRDRQGVGTEMMDHLVGRYGPDLGYGADGSMPLGRLFADGYARKRPGWAQGSNHRLTEEQRREAQADLEEWYS